MKIFWIVIGVLVALVSVLFISGTVYSNCKGYSNIIEWVKDWSIMQDNEDKNNNVEIELPEDIQSEIETSSVTE